MSKKDDFKNFVLNKPQLIDAVEDNKTTWQKLFELYDLYGEDSSIWNNYIENRITNNTSNIKGIINTIKNINLDSLEDNITQVQKIVDLVSEFTKKDDNKSETNSKEEKLDTLYGDKDEN